jgi:LmbE family N-acetylglucosaminyl deacetylase
MTAPILRDRQDSKARPHAEARSASGLPEARVVLAVTARPGQESAELGALLYQFGRSGSGLALLSLTRGEASRFNATLRPLEAVRPFELQMAAFLLGVSSVAISDYPDGKLSSCDMAALTERIRRAIGEHTPDLLLVLDPADSDIDSAVVALAASAAAQQAGVPAVARTGLTAAGGWLVDLGDGAEPAREAQRSAVAAHASQAEAMPELTRGLKMPHRWERLRWLVHPSRLSQPAGPQPRQPSTDRMVPAA